MGVKSFRELEVWRQSMDLVVLVYGAVGKFPSNERFALCDQLRRSVISIPSNIAEGFGRDSPRDFAHFLFISRGSLYEVDTQLEIAERMGYLVPSKVLKEKINSVSRLIAALIRHLLAKAPSTSGSAAKAPSTHSP